MKQILHLSLLLALVFTSSSLRAQNEAINIDSLKAEIKQELKQEILNDVKAEVEIKHGKKLNFNLYGFIRNFVCYDTRQNLASMGDTFNIMPLDELLNEDGTEDLNQSSELTFVAFTTRLGLDIAGPRLGKATSMAKVEADFCGYGINNTMLRLRHAYVKLAWDKVSVTMGQTWHPMAIQVLPTVVGFSPGVPIAQFNRTPQLNVDVKLGKGWNFLAAAMYQHPNTSVGPNGASYDYSRWSKIPELYASVKHAGEKFTVGVGVDYLSIMPRKTSTIVRETTLDGLTTSQSVTVKVNDRVTGISPEVFANYKSGLFDLKWKFIYGQNLAHLTMISGFGATSYNPDDGSYKYAPIRNAATWLNITYGKKCQVGIFGGFTQNLGAKDDFLSVDDFWVRGAKNTDYIYRIAPFVSYNAGPLQLAFEVDYTAVGYGDLAIDGRTDALREIGNLRTCLMVKYSF
ncbi:MAG: hypothetical protein IKL34_00670 [Alistipes sp.]|nr:hypothetical protein [Alistipes sp.]